MQNVRVGINDLLPERVVLFCNIMKMSNRYPTDQLLYISY